MNKQEWNTLLRRRYVLTQCLRELKEGGDLFPDLIEQISLQLDEIQNLIRPVSVEGRYFFEEGMRVEHISYPLGIGYINDVPAIWEGHDLVTGNLMNGQEFFPQTKSAIIGGKEYTILEGVWDKRNVRKVNLP